MSDIRSFERADFFCLQPRFQHNVSSNAEMLDVAIRLYHFTSVYVMLARLLCGAIFWDLEGLLFYACLLTIVWSI